MNILLHTSKYAVLIIKRCIYPLVIEFCETIKSPIWVYCSEWVAERSNNAFQVEFGAKRTRR